MSLIRVKKMWMLLDFWLIGQSMYEKNCHQLQVLKPCFERYADLKLSNVEPYHSEWRMKSDEDCLDFCALSLSRCSSVVYDKYMHVCHYFKKFNERAIVEIDQRMVLFKTTTKNCLGSEFKTLHERNSGYTAVFDKADINSQSTISTSTIKNRSENTSYKTTLRPIMTSLIAKRSDYVINKSSNKNNEKFKFSSVSVEKPSAAYAQIFPSIMLLNGTYIPTGAARLPIMYMHVQPTVKKVKEVESSKEHRSSENGIIQSKPSDRLQRGNADLVHTDTSSALYHKFQRISYQVSRDTNDLDDNINGCGENEQGTWLSIENAILSSKSTNKLLNAKTANHCRRKCNLITSSGRDCLAFTYSDEEYSCILHTDNFGEIESLKLIEAPEINFNTRTQIKFCLPAHSKSIKKCDEFIALPNFTITYPPREQYNGLPIGKAGLRACLELCISSDDFLCKSASFVINEGTCVLRDEDSMSKPSQFRQNSSPSEIYFENVCDRFIATAED